MKTKILILLTWTILYLLLFTNHKINKPKNELKQAWDNMNTYNKHYIEITPTANDVTYLIKGR